MSEFKLTAKQYEAIRVLGSDAMHCLLWGGSRSTKTFTALRAIAIRCAKAKRSRHAVLRFRFNHCKTSIVHDTWPKMMRLCFPTIPYTLDKTDWFARFPNGSEVWFGGLDDKERTEKILGNEYATIFLNECSQIGYQARNLALTRLAQKCMVDDGSGQLKLKAYYDCNPPGKGHWLYKLFFELRDPDSKLNLSRYDFAQLQMNPVDNQENLPTEYLESLKKLPPRMRLRFYDGSFTDEVADALWTLETIEKWRTDDGLPDMQRIVIAIDPSGADDEDNAGNDDIGIVVVGLGVDGNAYLLEDLTCKASPKVWGNIATTAFDRHKADLIVGETNYGGAMVKYVIQTQRKRTPFKMVTASRGKVVRAEPISALTESGKIRFAGTFPQLEDELCSFTTAGYRGENSPNRADAFVWAMSELFPGIVKEEKKPAERFHRPHFSQVASGGWMGA